MIETIDKSAQEKMQEELQKYLKKEQVAKSYILSMKEISTWLQEKVK